MCLFAIVASLAPRLALVLLWALTPTISQAYDSVLWPIFGFLFLPLTTIVYALFWTPTGLSEIGIFFAIVAVLADVGSAGGGAYGNRSRG